MLLVVALGGAAVASRRSPLPGLLRPAPFLATSLLAVSLLAISLLARLDDIALQLRTQVVLVDRLAPICHPPAAVVDVQQLLDEHRGVQAAGVRRLAGKDPPDRIEQAVGSPRALPFIVVVPVGVGLGCGKDASRSLAAGEVCDLKQGAPVVGDAVDEMLGQLKFRQIGQVRRPAGELAATRPEPVRVLSTEPL